MGLHTTVFDRPDMEGEAMEKDYVLMNKDLPLTSFHLKDLGNEIFLVTEVVQINNSPYDSERTVRLLLNQRKPAKNREYLEKLLKPTRMFKYSFCAFTIGKL